MRLNLFGWPPVASHLTCLIIGLGLGHLPGASGAPGDRTALSARTVLMSTAGPTSGASPHVGSDVVVAVRERSTGRLCLVSVETLHVVASGPHVTLRAPLRAGKDWNELLRRLAEPDVVLVPREGSSPLPPACAQGPRITYGSL
jgi:hypothetical protein